MRRQLLKLFALTGNNRNNIILITTFGTLKMTDRTSADDTRTRVFQAADQLYEQGGRRTMPKVHDVRVAAGVSSQVATSHMQEWRQNRHQAGTPVVVPEAVISAHNAALTHIWKTAKQEADAGLIAAQIGWEAERREHETVQQELSRDLDQRTTEVQQLEAAAHRDRDEIRKLQEVFSSATDRANRAEVGEQRQQAENARLSGELAEARASLQEAVKAVATERESVAKLTGQLGATQANVDKLLAKLAPA